MNYIFDEPSHEYIFRMILVHRNMSGRALHPNSYLVLGFGHKTRITRFVFEEDFHNPAETMNILQECDSGLLFSHKQIFYTPCPIPAISLDSLEYFYIEHFFSASPAFLFQNCGIFLRTLLLFVDQSMALSISVFGSYRSVFVRDRYHRIKLESVP